MGIATMRKNVVVVDGRRRRQHHQTTITTILLLVLSLMMIIGTLVEGKKPLSEKTFLYSTTTSTTTRNVETIDTTLNTTQMVFKKFTEDDSIPKFQVESEVTLVFEIFARQTMDFTIVIVSKNTNLEYAPSGASSSGSTYSYNKSVVGTIKREELKFVIPAIEVVEGMFVFRFKKRVEKVSEELSFDSHPFEVAIQNTSMTWPVIVLILFFPPALIVTAVIGGFLMCRRHKAVTQQEQELQDGEYQNQLDEDDVDIHFDHDDDDHPPRQQSRKNNQSKRDNEPRVAFVLEDDDEDDDNDYHPTTGHVHLDDDEDGEQRGNFYYTKNV